MTESSSKTIVVGIDGSEASKSALAWAVAEAKLRGATVVAVHAWQVPMTAYGTYTDGGVSTISSPELETIARETARATIADVVGDDSSVDVVTDLRHGHPARELVEASKDADLLVVGSEGHGAFAGMLLGSVSMHVVHHATCPVAVVRPGWAPTP